MAADPADKWDAFEWCRERSARVTWSQDETLCRVEVPHPKGKGLIVGEGPGFAEACLACLMRVETINDPPTDRMTKPEQAD